MVTEIELLISVQLNWDSNEGRGVRIGVRGEGRKIGRSGCSGRGRDCEDRRSGFLRLVHLLIPSAVGDVRRTSSATCTVHLCANLDAHYYRH